MARKPYLSRFQREGRRLPSIIYSIVKELFAGNPGVVPATTRAVAFVDESHPYSGERTSGRALWIRLLHRARIEMRQQHYGVNWTRKHPLPRLTRTSNYPPLGGWL